MKECESVSWLRVCRDVIDRRDSYLEIGYTMENGSLHY